jgi:hypothetical protein
MIYVSLGDSGIREMRRWFDRTLLAQLDYDPAWKDLLWGLRPRWYGSHQAMLALGTTALNTKRFDTDVPRIFFRAAIDVESELKLPAGQRIFNRKDVWPNLQQMYEGYIAEPSRVADREGWRSTYVAVAYLAGKLDVAASQLEALHWQPLTRYLCGWGADLSLVPLEVAARTGPLAKRIETAETARYGGDLDAALQAYAELAVAAEGRARAFVLDRLATLKLEQGLQRGGWVDFLPADESLSGWKSLRGECRRLPDGALEVKSGKDGHLLYSRARVGPEFEARGVFEVAHTSDQAFQAGLTMGLPDLESSGWCAFRLRRGPAGRDTISFSQGWDRRQVSSPAPLDGTTNTFHFRLQGGRISATVNGKELFQQVKPPKNTSLPDGDAFVGLGGYNRTNETVILYRELQIRKIAAK